MGPGDVMFGNVKLYRENFTKGAEIKRAKKEEGKQQTAKKERDRETDRDGQTGEKNMYFATTFSEQGVTNGLNIF